MTDNLLTTFRVVKPLARPMMRWGILAVLRKHGYEFPFRAVRDDEDGSHVLVTCLADDADHITDVLRLAGYECG